MSQSCTNEQDDILTAAGAEYDAQNSLHLIPLDYFIEKEYEQRQPGYQKPLSLAEIIKIVGLIRSSESKNIFKSSVARAKLIAIKYSGRYK